MISKYFGNVEKRWFLKGLASGNSIFLKLLYALYRTLDIGGILDWTWAKRQCEARLQRLTDIREAREEARSQLLREQAAAGMDADENL